MSSNITFYSNNVRAGASLLQLQKVKATQTICRTNQNVYQLMFSVVYGTTRQTLLIHGIRC